MSSTPAPPSSLQVDPSEFVVSPFKSKLIAECTRGSEAGLSKGRGTKEAVKVIAQLLDNGEDVNEGDEQGITPLITACRYGEDEIVDLLIQRGADIHATSKELKISPLLRACDHTWEHMECCRLLLKAGADVNVRDHAGWTPLMLATLARNVGLVKLLLKNGADHTVRVTQGMVENMTALDLARINDKEVYGPVKEVLEAHEKAVATGA